MQTRTRIHARLCYVLSWWCFAVLLSMDVLADDAADRRAIELAAQQWTKAFNARDAAMLTALTTEDVVVLDGSFHRNEGRVNARDAWLRVAALTRASVKSVAKEVVISGDVAWRVGAVMYQHSGSEWHAGQSLEIWQRTRDGWKLHRQMSSLLIDLLPRPVPSEPVLDKPTN